MAVGAACTHDRPPEEAKLDAQLPDANKEVIVATPPISVLIDGIDQPADISCNGTPRPDAGPIFVDAGSADGASSDADDASSDADATTASSDAASDGADASGVPLGTLVDKDIELIAFGTGGADKLPNEKIDVYYGNTFAGAPDLLGVTSDDKGIVRAKLPSGLRVGYHVRASELLNDFWILDDLHTAIPPVPLPRWQGITKARQEDLSLAITYERGYVLKPNTGIVSARVVDCQRRFVQYASISLKDYTDDPAGKELTFGKCGEGLCIVFLSDNELPDVDRQYTSRSSLFAMIDVPSNRKLGIIATGIAADGSVVQFARRMLVVQEGAITVQYMEPSNEINY